MEFNKINSIDTRKKSTIGNYQVVYIIIKHLIQWISLKIWSTLCYVQYKMNNGLVNVLMLLVWQDNSIPCDLKHKQNEKCPDNNTTRYSHKSSIECYRHCPKATFFFVFIYNIIQCIQTFNTHPTSSYSTNVFSPLDLSYKGFQRQTEGFCAFFKTSKNRTKNDKNHAVKITNIHESLRFIKLYEAQIGFYQRILS